MVAAAKNYFWRGNRGLDVLPNPLDWKRFVVTPATQGVSIPFQRRPPAEDEEKLMSNMQ